MQVGTGKSILNGIAIGKLKIYKKKDTVISTAQVADTAAEEARFEEARAKAIDQYAKYLAFDIVAGLLPLTFIPLGWAPWDVLVMVSGLVSLLVLLGLLVFARRQLFSEFGKQFSA